VASFVRPVPEWRRGAGFIRTSNSASNACDRLLDGMPDPSMLQIIVLGNDGEVAVIAPEDIIADRMGQFASGSATDMVGQARALFAVCEGLDVDYMNRRISEETVGDYGVQDLADEA
jgi:hypothetical protein